MFGGGGGENKRKVKLRKIQNNEKHDLLHKRIKGK